MTGQNGFYDPPSFSRPSPFEIKEAPGLAKSTDFHLGNPGQDLI
jgi:hypothetical protein